MSKSKEHSKIRLVVGILAVIGAITVGVNVYDLSVKVGKVVVHAVTSPKVSLFAQK